MLKGAALFTLWMGAPHRATRDVDLLGFGDPSAEHIGSVFNDVLTVEVDDDGVQFDATTLEVARSAKSRSTAACASSWSRG